MQEAILFSLCGVSTIITNHWSTKPENNLEIFRELLKGSATDGIYLGAALKRYWENYHMDKKDLIDGDPAKEEYKQKSRNLFK